MQSAAWQRRFPGNSASATNDSPDYYVGVDVGEGARAVDAIKDAVRSTARPEVIGGLGGFGSCFSMSGFKDMEDPILVSSTDGVGTKLAIAHLLDRHETVGQDLVAMCVDDIVPLGAEPLIEDRKSVV